MGLGLQNIGTMELRAKIFWNKELGEVRGWREGIAVFRLDCGEALRTASLCAFHILSKGCGSQKGEIFQWRVVEKPRAGFAGG
jgi:hypothetical protein